MPRSLLKLLLGMMGMLLAASVSALGMGGIQVMSALGQPLKAEIELLAVGKMEKASLVARLASPDAYTGAGLEFPHANKYSFKLDYHANGAAFLEVRSEQPVNDPFVSLLVDLSWASGRLLREYTFLLDPPGYMAAQPEAAQAEPVILPEAASALSTTPQPSESALEASADKAPLPAKPTAEVVTEKPAPLAAVDRSPAEEKKVAPAKPAQAAALPPVTLKRGDTLRAIAAQYKPEDVSLERMLLALYRVNAQQFDGKNMNRVRAGKILRLPDADDLAVVEQAEAVREIRAQVADWNAYRQRLASAAPASSAVAEAAQQQAGGQISSAVADKAPVASESAKEVLTLSKGDVPGDQVNAGGKGTVAERADSAQENRIADSKARKEEASRQALLEKNLEDMRRLAELKSEMAALTQPASAPEAASAVKAAPPVKKPRPVPAPAPVVEPTFIDMLLEEPVYLAAGAAVILLGAGGLGYSVWRRRKQAADIDSNLEFDDDFPEVSAAAPASDTLNRLEDGGDFTHLQAVPESHASAGIDPLSEADLYLNFGRYPQAEKILKDALAQTPADSQLILKLFGVYAASKNLPAFAAMAGSVHGQLEAAEWAQVQAQGRMLEPANPLYAGIHKEDAASATQIMATPVSAGVPVRPGKEEALDFDLGAMGDSAPDLGDGSKEVAIPDLEGDADLDSLMASMGATHLLAGGSVGQSETALSPSVPAQESEPASDEMQPLGSVADDAPLAFDIDFKLDEPAETPVVSKTAQASQIPGLGEISLSLEDVPSASGNVAEEKPPAWYDVQTKLDLARAYREMGDLAGAREVLEEAMTEGDDEQRVAARNMLDQLQ
ncbi:MAG: hypothetical protein PHW66_01035 [Gallionella sp.]|nr:hypothetical protein [Gallionella sp.]